MSEYGGGAGLVYIGCYTYGAGGEGAGITVARRDPGSGALRDARVVADLTAPSFLAHHPDHPVLYAVSEVADGQLAAFAIAADGGLTPLGSWSTGGDSPCHLSIGDGHVYVANYGGGSIAAFTLDADGRPTGRRDLAVHTGHGPNPQRQEAPHAHMAVARDGGVLVVDLGLDVVLDYPLDPATGALGQAAAVAAPRAGAGPRHMVRDHVGLYHVVTELDAGLVTYEVTGGEWREIGRAAASVEAIPAQPSEIALSPDGRFLYIGNRGPDTLAVFSLESGLPKRVGEVASGGAWPRHFSLIEDLLYVANERSNTVVAFRCDPATGLPEPTGDVLPTASPTCVLLI